MKETFNDITNWLWPFLGDIFTTAWDFIGGVLHSFFENQNSIMSIIGFVFLALLGLFLLDKLLRFIINYFSKFTKNDIISILKRVFIFTFFVLTLASFISYKTNNCG
jgi:preprotein translocase subunit SecE